MANKKGRRTFGSIRKERSGRYAARVPIPNSGGQHRSLGTFATKREADDAIAVERAAIVGGTFIDPARGQVTLAAYGARFVATNGYRPRSQALQERLLDVWVLPRHTATIKKQQHPIELGSRPLASITADNIRVWHTAVREASRRRAVARHAKAATSPKRVNAAIRTWAAEHGHAIAATGRIPGAIRKAWEADGGQLTSLSRRSPPRARRR